MPHENHDPTAGNFEPIAIIGVAGRFPGARNPEAFWRLLHEGVDAITEVPRDRWDIDAFYDPDLSESGKMNTRWGGFIEGMTEFDPTFFGISQGEANSMDPQHRLLLELSWEALEDAGLPPASIAGSATGVFVGISGGEYERACFADRAKLNAYFAAGNALCFASNRVSKYFDLQGPSICLDTGCSASLFALHLACQSLHMRETELCLVGGVNSLLSPDVTIAASQAWLMASDGRCKSFDAAADGYVRSEGGGMVVLKRLSDALEHGDTIWGIIRGLSVNQDGHGGSLTAPNPASQERLIRRTLKEAGVTPVEIDYIEAHGVATKAADLAEARALHAVFGEAPLPSGRRRIGSVKTNIGHLECGAGMAALIKVLLGLRHEIIPQNLHFENLHPDIAASGVQLDIVTSRTPWVRSDEHVRRAGINSFGLGGANGHLILEEPPARAAEAAPRALHLLTLSAKSERTLRTLAGRYADHIGSHPNDSFTDLCFTANTGRAHFAHRLAIVSVSAEEARSALAAFASRIDAPGLAYAHVTSPLTDDDEIGFTSLPLETDALRAAFDCLAALYLRGGRLNWARLEQGRALRKLSLPTYPFERRRCWIDDKPAARANKETQPEETPKLVQLLEGASAARRRNVLTAFVASTAASVMSVDLAAMDLDCGFAEMGMTSLMAIDFQRQLQVALGRIHVIPATLAFEYPTITALSDYLARQAFSHLIPLDTAPTRIAESAFHVSNEPIAIVAMACRFPGDANDPETFFRLLCEGMDAITEVPSDRWNVDQHYDPDPSALGKSYSRAGGFLRDIKQFDAEFFGISPREAAGMDPQQRLALEVSWEALEKAGLTREKLTGSQTGVFFGSIGSEYQQLRIKRGDLRSIDAYFGTGAVSSAISGRVAHFLGLQGPTFTIDAACASSLVAVHLACQSLRSGECRIALAGGVSVILLPEFTIYGCRVRALSPDDRCKTFDASANGYVRSEGAGVVALKRLSDALADGDEVLAVIAGSAVHHDGVSSGFTVPNGLSQQALLRDTLNRAGVAPADIGYVEAHGTGTSLGDPIEARALGAVLSEGRPANDPFMVGSVKTNIGHLEAAAGIAGLIKVILSLRHGQIPPLLHFRQLNPRISLDEVPAFIPTKLTSWPTGTRGRIAGVSSFGLSGTIAHVIVTEAPRQTRSAAPDDTEPKAHLLTLSGRTEQALRASAHAYSKFLSADGPGKRLPLPDICYTASVRRNHHNHRLVLTGVSHDEMVERLEAFLAGEARPGLSSGVVARAKSTRIVFICPGQGSQWFGMGKRLMREERAFYDSIVQCDAAMRPYADWSLIDVLNANEPSEKFERIDVIQPVLFAMEVALAALWSHWGIRPDVLIGHSMGEVAAAHIAGILSLDDASRVICLRSKLLRRLSGKGAMAVVDLPVEESRKLLAGREDRLSVAVSNSPRSTVISGDPAALQEVLATLQHEGVFCRLVKVDVASHSPQVDPILDELHDAITNIAPRPAAIPMVSTVTGGIGDEPSFDAAYWGRNLRDPVLFSKAVQHAMNEGCELFIEISPHPILLPAIEQIFSHLNKNGAIIPSLRRETDERTEMLSALGALHIAGNPVDFRPIHSSESQLVPLPPYPFQRERHWFEEEGQGIESEMGTGRRKGRTHPVLGERITLSSAPELHVWETDVSVELLPYLHDHLVQGTPVLPGMAYVSMALTAAVEVFGERPRAFADIEFHRALFLPDDVSRTMQTTLSPSGDGGARFLIHSRLSRTTSGRDDEWTLHMSARIEPADVMLPENSMAFVDMKRIQRHCVEPMAVTDFYHSLRELGNHFGPRHQGIKDLWRDTNEALGCVHLPQSIAVEAGAYFIHPAFLDACCQVGLAAVPIPDEPDGAPRPLGITGVFMPFRIDRLVVHSRPGTEVWTHARSETREGVDVAENLLLVNAEGRTLIEMIGMEARYLERSTETALPSNIEDWLYEINWQRQERHELPPSTSTSDHPKWLIFADAGGAGEALAAHFSHLGEPCVIVIPGPTYSRTDQNRFCIRPGEAADMARLINETFAPGRTSIRGVVHLWSLDAPVDSLSPASLRAAQTLVSSSVILLIQALTAQTQNIESRLWLVTQRVARVGKETVLPAIARAPIWGLARTISEEYPNLWGGFIDLCPHTHDLSRLARSISTDLRQSNGEDLIAFRNEQRYVARLVRRQRIESQKSTLRLRADGTYLVTGGLGGIGLELARWLIENGARRLILMGRTPLPSRSEWANIAPNNPVGEQIASIRSLESLGATIHLAAVDVCNQDSLEAFFASFRREAWPPIRGVIHAAAVAHEKSIGQLDEATLLADIDPKLVGGYLLHHLLEDAPLDFFVLFSSGSAILSSPFLGAYAAANAAVDALAHYRRALGRTVLSVNWGFWAEVGLTAKKHKDTGRSMAPQGMGSFTPSQAFSIMKLLLEDDATQTMVMPVNWTQWSGFYAHSAKSPLYSQLIQEKTGLEKPAHLEPSLRRDLLGIEPDWRRRAKLETYLQEQVGKVLRLSPSKIGIDVPLGSFGLDSLMGLELRGRFEANTGLTLPATLIWTYPTVADLATHLALRMDIPLDASTQSLALPNVLPEVVPEPDEDMSEEEAAAMLADVLAMVRERKAT